MALSMLGSLALTFLLVSNVLHLVVLVLPAWVQLGAYVPFTNPGKAAGEGAREGGGGGRGGGGEGGGRGVEGEDTFSNVTGGGVAGGLEDGFKNATEAYSNSITAVTAATATATANASSSNTAVAAMTATEEEEEEEDKKEKKEMEEEDSDNFAPHKHSGPRVFVNIRLGLFQWCQQFREVSPDCEEPGFVSGVGVMAVVALFTLPIAFLLLCYSACLQKDSRKRRLFTQLSLFCSAFSGLILMIAVTTYGVLGTREVTAMFLQIGELQQLRTFLGWAFGAEGVTSLLALLAALFLGLHLRRTPKSTPEFQLVV